MIFSFYKNLTQMRSFTSWQRLQYACICFSSTLLNDFSSDNLNHRCNPADRTVQAIILMKWTEPLNIVFACKGKEQQLRYINQTVDHGNSTVKDKSNQNREMHEAASMHHQPLFAWKPKPSFCRGRWKTVALFTLWAKLTRHVLQSKSWHCRVP